MTKLIYIGGYGRSGSTLLEYLLSSHPSLVACGEIQRSFRRFEGKKQRLCTCGQRLPNCSVWGPFRQRWKKLQGLTVPDIILLLLESVSGDYEVMVDSSKTTWGSVLTPWQLSRKIGPDFLLLHLVRDPRGVCWSNIKSSARPKKNNPPRAPGMGAVRTILAWSMANLACEIFRWRFPDRYVLVNYDELTSAPDAVISGILSRIGLSRPSCLLPTSQSNRHQLHGNAMRFKTLSLSDIKADTAWKTEMARRYQVLVAVLCWPLMLRYKLQ